MIRTPAFWWREKPSLAARLLMPFGALYGGATLRRMTQNGVRLRVPVIVIGNAVAGGAGKTPATIAIAGLLKQTGQQPAIVSRGYGGLYARRDDALRVIAQRADLIGDEAMLLARAAPAFVSGNRMAAATLAMETTSANVLLLDDGLQSRVIAPDLALMMIDGETGTGNGLCIPAGPLRAPLAQQLDFADVLIVVGEGAAGERIAAQARGKTILRARLEPGPEALALKGERVVAFAGIGRPQKFFTMLERLGAQIIATRSFGDHHVYRTEQINALRALAARSQALLLTTEKDATRLPALNGPGPMPRTIPVRLVFDDESAITTLLADSLQKARATRL